MQSWAACPGNQPNEVEVNMKPLFVLSFTAAISALLALPTAKAEPSTAESKAIERFLKAHSNPDDQENAEMQGNAIAYLDNDKVPEIVLVWTTLGPTYWRNTLSVLKKVGNEYREAASQSLEGEAVLDRVQSQTILVRQKVRAPNDPICCPSIERVKPYQFINGKLVPTRQ